MQKLYSVIAQAPLYAEIPPQELPALLAALEARIAHYARGEYLFHAGQPTPGLGLLLEGRVLVLKEDFWGGRNLMNAIAPGQCFAETFACVPGSVAGVSAVADTGSTVLFLNVRCLLRPGVPLPRWQGFLLHSLMADMAAKNLAFTERLTHLGQRTTRAKLLSYLSAQAQKQGCVEFNIPFSRQQLADYLLVDRSGLSQELCKMRDEGLLCFNKNHFVLQHQPDL